MTSLSNLKIGQCWMSEAEPELGLGFLVGFDFQTISVQFPQANEMRRYGKRTAPLKRARWQPGDQVQDQHGVSLVVESIEERDGLLWYIGDKLEICENQMAPATKPQGPIGRLLSGQWDPPLAYNLRQRTLHAWSRTLGSPVRGLLGPRVDLIPHQVHVVSQISKRALPRALLADEVGLGKTIEAGWIAHQLIATGRVRKVLVLAPQSMLNQWFVELLRRFNLSFSVPEANEEFKLLPEDFSQFEQLILSLEVLQDDALSQALHEVEWDLIIVDEAHHIEWSPENPSKEYKVLQQLSQRSRGLLLLTATPEQLGIQGHFGRLHLLDPLRFPNFEDFLAEHDKYAEIVKLAQPLISGQDLKKSELSALQKLLDGKVPADTWNHLSHIDDRMKLARTLVDYHGTGRVFFRNARKVVGSENYKFPKRRLNAVALEPATEADAFLHRLHWLRSALDTYPQDKFLLICSSRQMVEKIETTFQTIVKIKTAQFHEAQSLLDRDRNAAYFAEPSGARLLISSEIGSEGRNFQFARHLILWDLPSDPDLLEQRIGRLDRIGQAQEFWIHVPFQKGTAEEILFRWYHEVFGAFEELAQGAGSVHSRYKEELRNSLELSPAKLDQFILKAQKDYAATRLKLDQGRDQLIEVVSFQPNEALKMVQLLKKEEHSEDLQDYMQSVFSWVGVNEEDLDAESFFVEPGDNMFIPVFPGLPDKGLRITYHRKKSLERDDLSLLSWDHYMVRQTMETIIGQEFGNASVLRWRTPHPSQVPLAEFNFVLQCSADPQWYADEFLAPKPLREVLDAQGRFVTKTWPAARIISESSRLKLRPEDWTQCKMRDRLQILAKAVTPGIVAQADEFRKRALFQMEESIGDEIARLENLGRKNRLVTERELDWWNQRRSHLQWAFSKGDLRLDSLRIVF